MFSTVIDILAVLVIVAAALTGMWVATRQHRHKATAGQTARIQAAVTAAGRPRRTLGESQASALDGERVWREGRGF
jgi:hypothetical protein